MQIRAPRRGGAEINLGDLAGRQWGGLAASRPLGLTAVAGQAGRLSCHADVAVV